MTVSFALLLAAHLGGAAANGHNKPGWTRVSSCFGFQGANDVPRFFHQIYFVRACEGY
jgi:hypothetical protein